MPEEKSRKWVFWLLALIAGAVLLVLAVKSMMIGSFDRSSYKLRTPAEAPTVAPQPAKPEKGRGSYGGQTIRGQESQEGEK